eukprot:CAMPEP_0206139012 /NCGR_PEP_ID=MMETSP1473-20131121/4376_1 /ASSEMBLY_ACC=CAM_ASM_001109 /TAXON_ID=1461547 /ORGANISM="Stichococcus sp, Strain RCC1054" /LENGTH=281 /DNA_ID=CAMNT_0053532621 /DNA_START=239 /DNA_END=1081 /DNA_ORIENTATION=+
MPRPSVQHTGTSVPFRVGGAGRVGNSFLRNIGALREGGLRKRTIAAPLAIILGIMFLLTKDLSQHGNPNTQPATEGESSASDICSLFQPAIVPEKKASAFNIAVVGSQPISEALRKVVASMDLVIRTDCLTGFQPGDPMAIWVLQLGRGSSRNATEVLPPDLTVINQGERRQPLGVVALGAPPNPPILQALENALPGIDLIHQPENTWYQRQHKSLPTGGKPSTTFVGLSIALQCIAEREESPAAKLHLFGGPITWHPRHDDMAQSLIVNPDAETAIGMVW